jgi:DNA-directed RNA polymerase subunit RPC12/RpoP
MATRNSKHAAEELKTKWEAEYPGSEFVIIDRSGIQMIGKFVAEENGYEIIEGNGPRVKAKVTEFEVLEVKHCHNCGAEVLSAAIGEASSYECVECRNKLAAERHSRSEEAKERSRQSVAAHAAFDDFWG